MADNSNQHLQTFKTRPVPPVAVWDLSQYKLQICVVVCPKSYMAYPAPIL